MSVTFERSLGAEELMAGTRMSTKGMQTMTSTGIPSIDGLFGGGLPLNSITLLEEDDCSQWSAMIGKCFTAEGIESKHKIIISSPTISSKRHRFLRELPNRSTQPEKQLMDRPSGDDIQIAWRYKSQPLVADKWSTADRQFDFGSHISEELLNSADIDFCPHDSCLDIIRALPTTTNKTVTRLIIDGLGSPLSALTIKSLPKFLYALKSLVRKMPNILCLITFSAQLVLLSDYSYVRSRVHNIADGVVQLVGFDECTQTPYTEYNGLFNVVKVPKLNSFNYYSTPETLDLGFQLKNKNRFLSVDKLCLPPDLSETVSRTTGCATAGPDAKRLEF